VKTVHASRVGSFPDTNKPENEKAKRQLRAENDGIYTANHHENATKNR
jgi:hypothetical protein